MRFKGGLHFPAHPELSQLESKTQERTFELWCDFKQMVGGGRGAVRRTPTCLCIKHMSFPGGTVVKNPPANVGDSRDVGSSPGLEGSPGIRNGNPLWNSSLENSMDSSWATVHRVTKELDMTEHTHAYSILRVWIALRSVTSTSRLSTDRLF